MNMNLGTDTWELEKEKLLLTKKKQRLLESLAGQPHRTGYSEQGPTFVEGDYFVHPRTQELWLATGPYSVTWGTEVYIYSASIGQKINHIDQCLKEMCL
jgi:hypothetical protein